MFGGFVEVFVFGFFGVFGGGKCGAFSAFCFFVLNMVVGILAFFIKKNKSYLRLWF